MLGAYNLSVASPPVNAFGDLYTADAMKVEKRQYNPWARKMPMERDVDQRFTPRFGASEHRGPRFITEQELEALNNPSTMTREPRSSHGWMPLPMLDESRKKPRFRTPSYSQPSDNRFVNDYRTGVRTDNNQWAVPSMVLPVDPMDPGRSGAPLSGPFRGIDSFMYE